MITFDGIIFSARNRLGGVSVYFRNLIEHAAACFDVSVVTYAGADAALVGCHPQQVAVRKPRLLERFRHIGAVAPGILHSSYYRTCAHRGVRNVVTVYDFTYERFAKGLRALVHTRQKSTAIARADAVICISEHTRRDLLRLLPHLPHEKVFVTHLAADEHFKPLRAPPPAAAGRPFVLFVGGRAGYKNFTTAVQALSRVRDCELMCVGGEPFSADELALLESAVPGRYSHAGAVSVPALNELYNSAVCLLYPSLYEGFGIPPLEAMRAGCPFVALNHSSIPEVAGDAGILLEGPDPEVMARAIEACTAPERRAELRDRGLARAGQFSWRATFDKTLPIYRALL
jgi:mannosyltransferase